MHYADDAIITIKQNKCFKEVITDLLSAISAAPVEQKTTTKNLKAYGAVPGKTVPIPL